MRTGLAIILLTVAASAAGCAASGESCGPGCPAWARRYGGAAPEPPDGRVHLVCRDILALSPAPLDVQILGTGEIEAHVWVGHAVFISRGLLAAMDDAELQAVVAHEMGHVLAASSRMQAGLRGCPIGLEAEVEADRVGRDLVKRNGGNPSAMLRMLRKVAASVPADSACERGLRERIRRLNLDG